jgi:hypothetical protein
VKAAPIAPEPTAPATDAPASPPTSADSAPRWPEWFVGADVALALCSVLLAFLLGSFLARNTDLWLYLAGGRNIVEGNLALGGDPFSFANRAWVHTTWLFDLVAYVLYMMDQSGAMLVGAKALGFAAAFGLVYRLRQPGQSLWPWAVVVVIGILAATPHLHLRPLVASMFFLSLTMVLIERLDWQANGWKAPLTLAGVFAIWANVDVWFFLGPLALVAVIIGEFVNRFLGGNTTDATYFAPAKPVNALVKALLLSVIAVSLNPFFLAAAVKDPTEAVAQLLPMELGFALPAGATEDTDLRLLTTSPMSLDFQNKPELGANANGYSYAALLILGILSLLMGYTRLRGAHITLWLVFGGLSLLHMRLIPFFAIIVVPIIAGHINCISSNFQLGTWTNPKTRILLTASSVGRLLTLVAAFGLLMATYPGWLHPQLPKTFAHSQPRLDWGFVVDSGLERSTKLLEDMRTQGKLPASAHGLATSLEFGNYAAWFAPQEKCFVNSRYAFHRTELPDYLIVRQVSTNRDPEKILGALKDIDRVFQERKPAYLVVASRAMTGNKQILFSMIFDNRNWTLWHLDGRCTLLGRMGLTAEQDKAAFAMAFDTTRIAFGPDMVKLPLNKSRRPMPLPTELAEEYIYRPLPIPTGADDAEMYRIYADIIGRNRDEDARREMAFTSLAYAAIIGPAMPGIFGVPNKGRIVEDEQFTLPVAMIRAARQAIFENPDTIDPYMALIEAYKMPLAPTLEVPTLTGLTERQMQTLCARIRALDRIPAPGQADPFNSILGINLCFDLNQDFEQSSQLDGMKKTFDRLVDYFEKLPEAGQKAFVMQKMGQNSGMKPEDALKRFKAEIDNRQLTLQREAQRATDSLARITDPTQQFITAAQNGMTLKAIDIFNTSLATASKAPAPQIVIQKIVLELRAGKLDDAIDDLNTLDNDINEILKKNPGDEIGTQFRLLQALVSRLDGNPAQAAEYLPKTSLPKVTWDKTNANLNGTLAGLAALGGGLVNVVRSEQAGQTQAPLVKFLGSQVQTRNILLQESLVAHERAFMALIDGSTADAKQWFLIAAKPQGIPLTELGDIDRANTIQRYLQLLDRAGVK